MVETARSQEELASVLRDRSVMKTLANISEQCANVTDLAISCVLDTYAPKTLFDDLVISKLPRPSIVTEEDLQEAFAQQVLMWPDRAFEESYLAFAAGIVAAAAVDRISSPLQSLKYEETGHF